MVVSQHSVTLETGQEIKDGQNVWHSMGDQIYSTVWEHGVYQASDLTPEWLHKKAGLWYANSAKYMQQLAMETLK